MDIDFDNLDSFLPKELAETIKKSVEIIEDSLTRYKLDELAIAFNGGKDSTVLLHLLHCVIKRHLKRSKLDTDLQHPLSSVLTIFFDTPDSFQELTQFTLATGKSYGLDLQIIKSQSIKEGMKQIPNRIKAVYIGTRSSDPHGASMKPFTPTDSDKGWVPLMRVNPILCWNYKDVWDFLKIFKVKYCSLYDAGYTSIGSVKTTKPNPSLLSENGYKPADKLEDDKLEREGR